jgi:PPOX class probable F420-dependent enzyme
MLRRDGGPRRPGGHVGIMARMSVPTPDQHAARLDRFLYTEPVVWLSTVRPDGAPHLVPIWFTWDGSSLLVFSKPGAQKVRNLRAHPVAMLALGEPEDDFDVALAEATVRLLDEPASELPPAHLAKYGERMAALGLSPDEFLATYSQVMVITPSRSLPWHGRTTPRSVLAVATIQEPVRARELFGEPLGACPETMRLGPEPVPSPEPEPASGWWATLVRALTGPFRPAPSPLSSSAS